MSERDPLWVSFPRWLEESGLPEFLVSQLGMESWLIFRKLVELDCDFNLTPQWFPFQVNDLTRWTGLAVSPIERTLTDLEKGEWIERANTDQDVQTCRICTPLEVPLNEAAIRENLSGKEVHGGAFILRYYQNQEGLSNVERIVYLYQMLFGARFSPRIAEDLEEIANSYNMGVIYDIFNEAHLKKAKSLAWIKSHLKKVVETEPD